MKPNMKKRSLMIGLFAVLLTFSLGNQSGSFSLAVPSALADLSYGEVKDKICHHPRGNETNFQTVDVGRPSVLNAHMHHHNDEYGACFVCPPGVASCFSADGSPGTIVTYGANTTGPSSQRNLKGS